MTHSRTGKRARRVPSLAAVAARPRGFRKRKRWRIPNAATRTALRAARRREGVETFASAAAWAKRARFKG
jgi:hypothetical protein